MRYAKGFAFLDSSIALSLLIYVTTVPWPSFSVSFNLADKYHPAVSSICNIICKPSFYEYLCNDSIDDEWP